MEQNLIKLQNINKSFFNSKILSDISISIGQGEVIVLFGENGSGKTLLCNIISGVMKPDTGLIEYKGSNVSFKSIEDASKSGVKMIFQDCQLIDNLTVAENIYLKNQITKNSSIRRLNRKKLIAKAQIALAEINSTIDASKLAGELSIPEKKIVEIAKALSSPLDLLIMDEITESFSTSDVPALIKLIKQINSRGIAIILVSHHINELHDLNKRILILKDGKIIDDSKNFKKLSQKHIYKKIAGENLLNRYPKTSRSKKEILFSVKNLTNEARTILGASLTLRKGEILGIYGMDSSGKSSLTRLLCGDDRNTSGNLEYYGQHVYAQKNDSFFNHGIGYLSDSIEKNVFLDLDAATNIIIGKQSKASSVFTLNNQKIKTLCEHYSRSLNISMSVFKEKVRHLSRGTQQKIAIARLLNSDCSLFIMDEPSNFLDIPSKVELYNIMNKLALSDKSIIISSSSIEEVVGMCDRIYIISNGKIVTEINSDTYDIPKILKFVLNR